MAQPRTSFITHVASKGFELVEVIVHTAANVPIVNSYLPNSYVTSQSKYTLNSRSVGNKPNATVSLPGQFPVWNDLLFVETLEENVANEELILLIIDETVNLNLAEFRIPWIWLQPFYQYHLELNYTNNKRSFEFLKLYVSITRKPNLLSTNDFKYYGLEILMNKFDTALSQKITLYSACRIVPNYSNYKNNFLKLKQSQIEFTQITVINRSLFNSKSFGIEGYPQLGLASKPASIPTWNHSYCFSTNEEKDAMFSDRGDPAIIIEFYTFNKYNGQVWLIDNLLGWCKIKLDKRCRIQLEDDSSGLGLKTELMLVETDGSLSSVSSELTAEAVVRLVSEKSPRKTLSSIQTSSIPVLNSYYTEESFKNNIEPVYLQPEYSRPQSFKPIARKTPRVIHTPVNQIPKSVVNPSPPTPQLQNLKSQTFSDFQQTYLKTDFSKPKIKDPDRLLLFNRDDFADVPIDYRYSFLNYRQPTSIADLEGWINYYQDLISAYKALVRKMNEDLVLYRQQIRNLEISNTQLSTKMSNFEDKKQALLKLAEMNETDKSKLNQTFLELKTRLAIKTNENVVLQDQIERLKRELDKKKVLDMELKRMLSAQNIRNNELQQMQQRLSKAYGLEDTVKRQELVIEKLEKFIHQLISEKRKNSNNRSDYFSIKNEIDDIKNVDLEI